VSVEILNPADLRDGHQWSVPASRDLAYKVEWRDQLFGPIDATLANTLLAYGGNTPVVFVDQNVEALHGAAIRSYFQAHDVSPHYVVREVDESRKTLGEVHALAAIIDDLPVRRRTDPFVVIAGGVLLDIVGFLASIYRRGMPYIRIPTTLVGLIDAGIGVKTGVNAHGHKNRLGTYWPPDHVFLTPTFLASLPIRHVRNGIAEIIKLSLMRDRALFELLEGSLTENRCAGFVDHAQAVDVCTKAVTGMLAELSPNLWEKELRRPVDFGHSFSPALELGCSDLLHGEAVACDMALCTAFAFQRGLLSARDLTRVFQLLKQAGLRASHPGLSAGLIANSLSEIIRHRDGMQHIPVATGIGTATFIEDSTESEWLSAKALCDAEEAKK
jgi:3-dehydroquinate synthase